MRTIVELPFERPGSLPDKFADDDVRMPPNLVAHLLEEYTAPGDAVLDPFAGFGTTLRVATDRDRIAHGVEYERDRVAYVRERGGHGGNLVRGDARELGSLDLPPIECCLTSPPFMVRGTTANPLENYAGETDYESYLAGLRDVFADVSDLLVEGGRAILHVTNAKYDGEVTTLAWDLADAVGDVLRFEGEVVVAWTGEGPPERDGRFGFGYDHSYCLVFRSGEADDAADDGPAGTD